MYALLSLSRALALPHTLSLKMAPPGPFDKLPSCLLNGSGSDSSLGKQQWQWLLTRTAAVDASLSGMAAAVVFLLGWQ